MPHNLDAIGVVLTEERTVGRSGGRFKHPTSFREEQGVKTGGGVGVGSCR